MNDKKRKEVAQRMTEHRLKTNGLLDRKVIRCVLCQGVIPDGGLFYEAVGMRAHVDCVDKELAG